MDELADAYRGWVDQALSKGKHFRDGKWTESVYDFDVSLTGGFAVLTPGSS